MGVRTALVWLVAAAAAAGCLQGGTGGADVDPLWWERAVPSGSGHDHLDTEQHRGLSTPNFRIVGHDPLRSEHYGAPSGGTFCGDAQAGPEGRRIAVVETRTDVAAAFADVTDPATPRWIGEIVMPETHIYDVAMVPDGRHAVMVSAHHRTDMLAAVHTASTSADAGPMLWRTPCGTSTVDEDVPLPATMFLVDVLAPGGPSIVERQPLGGFGHSVLSVEADGAYWVVVSSAHFRTRTALDAAVGDTSTVGGYGFYFLEDGPGGPTLRLRSFYKPPPDEAPAPTTASLAPRAHDAWLQKHPGTGQTIAYLAGGHRFTILDVTDPARPAELARWTDVAPGREGHSGNLHSAFALEGTWDGRHYTVLGPEYANHPTDHPSGIVWVLDTTDPTAPEAVAAWTLPAEVEWDGTYMFSTHYFAVMGETLFMSMYHGGVWAVDLAPIRGAEEFVQLPSVGVWLPGQDPVAEPAESHRWRPTVEEVVPIAGDTFLTFEGHTGLYTVAFDAGAPAPPPTPWPVTPV